MPRKTKMKRLAAQVQSEEQDESGTGGGVLILSEFAGAARDLPEAIIINPYDTEQFAEAIRTAVEMDAKEHRVRLTRMRVRVEEHNIYRWATDFIAELSHNRNKSQVNAA